MKKFDAISSIPSQTAVFLFHKNLLIGSISLEEFERLTLEKNIEPMPESCLKGPWKIHTYDDLGKHHRVFEMPSGVTTYYAYDTLVRVKGPKRSKPTAKRARKPKSISQGGSL